MAVQTYTCTIAKNQVPKTVQEGDQSVSGFIMEAGGTNAGASTIGDILILCKIPHGARIVDFWEYHSTGASTQGLQFGLSKGVAAGGGAGLSCFLASSAQNTMNRFSMTNWKAVAGTVGPPTVSVSDTDTSRYANLQAQIVSGTTTTSLKVWFNIIYRMDGPYESLGTAAGPAGT